jgi:hypothetical protein
MTPENVFASRFLHLLGGATDHPLAQLARHVAIVQCVAKAYALQQIRTRRTALAFMAVSLTGILTHRELARVTTHISELGRKFLAGTASDETTLEQIAVSLASVFYDRTQQPIAFVSRQEPPAFFPHGDVVIEHVLDGRIEHRRGCTFSHVQGDGQLIEPGDVATCLAHDEHGAACVAAFLAPGCSVFITPADDERPLHAVP